MMSRIAALSSCVVFICCFCQGGANILGPPPGSLGTIDFRYPDIIVDPLPECPFEGTFPHPNNCTWYYRCYSHYPGFYNRAYFHCEPGTIFNDVLDQCTWGHWSECQNSGVVSPPPALPCTNCINVIDPQKCDSFRACPGPLSSPRDLHLCTDVIKSCTPCNLSEMVCGSSQVFSTEDKLCYPLPDSPAMACPSVSPTPPPPIVEPTPPPVPCDQCSISATRCRSYQVCPSGAAESSMLLCPTAKNLCLPCGTEEDVCPPGMFYSMMDTQCYNDPKSASMSCSTPSPPPSPTPSPSPSPPTSPPSSPPPPSGGSVIITDTSDHPIQCSYDNLIPSDEWIQKKFCSKIPLCTNGLYMGITTLCSNYYQCILKENGEWEAVVSNCPDGLMYSFKDNRCSAEPLPEERCGNLFFQ